MVGLKQNIIVACSPQSAGVMAAIQAEVHLTRVTVYDAKGAVVDVRELCDLDEGQQERHKQCVMAEVELRREDGGIGLRANRKLGNSPPMGWYDGLEYSWLMDVVELPRAVSQSEGEDNWILLQFDSRHTHDLTAEASHILALVAAEWTP